MATLKLFYKVDGMRKWRKSSLSVSDKIKSVDAIKHVRDFLIQHGIDNNINPYKISARFEDDNGNIFVPINSDKTKY